MIVVHVSVVAVLTLLVNAPTTGPLLGALGMLQTPRQKEHALEDLRSRMQDYVLARYRAATLLWHYLLCPGKVPRHYLLWHYALWHCALWLYLLWHYSLCPRKVPRHGDRRRRGRGR